MPHPFVSPGLKSRPAADPAPFPKFLFAVALALAAMAALNACSSRRTERMEVTAYCGCAKCTDWERGSWRYLKLDFWNRYVSRGPDRGRPYSGRTASGTWPREPRPGLLSTDTITHPWMLPFRLLFPWLWFAHDGTVAADTRYIPMGTRLHIPGYGFAVVEDRGGAIKGPRRLDVYFDSHARARRWGRQNLTVQILK